jgi:hypothetical protein
MGVLHRLDVHLWIERNDVFTRQVALGAQDVDRCRRNAGVVQAGVVRHDRWCDEAVLAGSHEVGCPEPVSGGTEFPDRLGDVEVGEQRLEAVEWQQAPPADAVDPLASGDQSPTAGMQIAHTLACLDLRSYPSHLTSLAPERQTGSSTPTQLGTASTPSSPRQGPGRPGDRDVGAVPVGGLQRGHVAAADRRPDPRVEATARLPPGAEEATCSAGDEAAAEVRDWLSHAGRASDELDDVLDLHGRPSAQRRRQQS